MFKIITPSEQRYYPDLTSCFMKKLRSRNATFCESYSDFANAIYILAQENPGRVNGGAIFFQRKEKTLHPLVRERLDAYLGPEQDIWIGSLILELKSDLSGQDYECFCKLFYRYLYEALVTFGAKEKTSFLCLNLLPPEHFETDLLNFWPYVLTIRPKDSEDGHFHSILALTGHRNETARFWKSLDMLTKMKGFAA